MRQLVEYRMSETEKRWKEIIYVSTSIVKVESRTVWK